MKCFKCPICKLLLCKGKLKINFILAVFVIISVFFLLPGTILAATHTAASCSMSDVQAAINNSETGDTVIIPAGTSIWGENRAYLSVNKAITLTGAGQGQTIITISDTAAQWTAAIIRISASTTVKSMTINGSDVVHAATFSTGTANGWRITDIDYNGGSSGAYFVYVGNVYGLIDNNNIAGGVGNAELIFVRGPTDSWQTPHSIGGADNVFIEDNIFNGQGYVCDINSNGRAVVRYNTINGKMKIDGHGKASNTPPRGVRHMEVYNNTWTNTSNYWAAIELRGGGGRIFDNVIESSSAIWVILTEYGCTGTWPNFGNTCQCPADYPIDDQIGVGIDPKFGASEPMYLWNNTKNGSPWVLTWKSTANCTPTCGAFNMYDIIKEGRDYFMSNTKPAAIAGYTSFTYPHPLTVSPPEKPKNLKIVQ